MTWQLLSRWSSPDWWNNCLCLCVLLTKKDRLREFGFVETLNLATVNHFDRLILFFKPIDGPQRQNHKNLVTVQIVKDSRVMSVCVCRPNHCCHFCWVFSKVLPRTGGTCVYQSQTDMRCEGWGLLVIWNGGTDSGMSVWAQHTATGHQHTSTLWRNFWIIFKYKMWQ